MLAIIFTLLISCATGIKLPHAIREVRIPEVTVTTDGMPYIPMKIKQDTAAKARAEYRKKIEDFMRSAQQSFDENHAQYKSQSKLDADLQRLVITQSAKLGSKDSFNKIILDRLISMQDTINATKRQNASYYKQAEKARAQIILVNNTYNWQFALLGILILASTIGSSVLKYIWIKKYSV